MQRAVAHGQQGRCTPPPAEALTLGWLYLPSPSHAACGGTWPAWAARLTCTPSTSTATPGSSEQRAAALSGCQCLSCCRCRCHCALLRPLPTRLLGLCSGTHPTRSNGHHANSLPNLPEMLKACISTPIRSHSLLVAAMATAPTPCPCCPAPCALSSSAPRTRVGWTAADGGGVAVVVVLVGIGAGHPPHSSCTHLPGRQPHRQPCPPCGILLRVGPPPQRLWRLAKRLQASG